MATIEAVHPGAYQAFVEARRRWTAWRAKTIDAAEARAHVGQRVKVCGVAQPIERPLVAQFTGREALFYEVVSKRRRPSSQEDYSWWRPLFHSMSTSPFFLVGDDGTKVLVEPTIAIHSLRVKDLPADAGETRTEARLAPGARAVVFGLVDETPAVIQVGYRADATTMARLLGTTTDPLVIGIARAPK